MQQYMKVQYLINKENIHQTTPLPKPRVGHPMSGPFKAEVVQSVEEHLGWNKMKKDHIMIAL
eukprot:11670810-Prorocentrum_lima.AAC.1